jgi:hypothetical protein
MGRHVHPLVTMLAGAVFGGLFGAWIAWELAQLPTTSIALWGAAIGCAVVVGLLAVGAGCRSLYRTVPAIRDYTNGAFARGKVVGAELSIWRRWGDPARNPHTDAVAMGCLFGAVGFVIGCVVALGRVILRRKDAPTPSP